MINQDRGGRAPKLALPACPICYTPASLFRRQAVVAGDRYVWYECEACGSALMWVGGGRWAYQKIDPSAGQGAGRVELKQPMTAAALWRLLPRAEMAPDVSPRTEPAPAVADDERPPPPPGSRMQDLRASLLEEAARSGAAPESASASLPTGFIVGAAVLLACLILSIALSVYVALTPDGEATPAPGPTITTTPAPATVTLTASPTAEPGPAATQTPGPTLVPTLTPEPTPEGGSSRRWPARHGAGWSGPVRGC
jgi:hypothetical protein